MSTVYLWGKKPLLPHWLKLHPGDGPRGPFGGANLSLHVGVRGNMHQAGRHGQWTLPVPGVSATSQERVKVKTMAFLRCIFFCRQAGYMYIYNCNSLLSTSYCKCVWHHLMQITLNCQTVGSILPKICMKWFFFFRMRMDMGVIKNFTVRTLYRGAQKGCPFYA